jgi:hypothetical protein
VVVADPSSEAPVSHAESIPTGSPADVASLLERQKVGRTVRIAPSGSTVAAVAHLPEGPEADLLAALELMAEAELPSRAPAWRRGWGLVPLPAAAGTRAGLLVGWLGDAPAPAIPGAPRERWTSEVAALAFLLDEAETGYALSADREGGSVGIVAAGAEHALARTCRETAADGAAWARAVSSLARECGVEVEPGAGDQVVALDAASMARLRGRVSFPVDERWASQYAVAAGAAIGATRGAPARALFALSDAEPRPEVSPVERAAAWFGAPGRAWGVIAASAALAVVGFWGSSLLEASSLEGKLEAVAAGDLDTDRLRQRAAFFGELDRRRWPMTKILSEISRAAPVGVEAESIRVTTGEGVVFRGIAESSAQLKPFVESLDRSDAYAVRVPREENTSDGFEFELAIDVRAAHREAPDLEDFAERTLGHRLYGEEYDEVAAKDRAADEAAEERRLARKEGGSSRSDRIFDGSERRAEPAEPVPEALAEGAIDGMDFETARTEFGKRMKASARQDIDEADQRRLDEEVRLLRERLRALRGGG